MRESSLNSVTGDVFQFRFGIQTFNLDILQTMIIELVDQPVPFVARSHKGVELHLFAYGDAVMEVVRIT